MIPETNHDIELLLAPDAVELLENAPYGDNVISDLLNAIGDVDIVTTPEGTELRQSLDTTISYEGMCLLNELASDDEVDDDIQNLCQTLVEVAEPCDEGSLLMEVDSESGEFQQVHVFDPDADLIDDLGDEDVDKDNLERFSNAMESFIEDHSDNNDPPR